MARRGLAGKAGLDWKGKDGIRTERDGVAGLDGVEGIGKERIGMAELGRQGMEMQVRYGRDWQGADG